MAAGLRREAELEKRREEIARLVREQNIAALAREAQRGKPGGGTVKTKSRMSGIGNSLQGTGGSQGEMPRAKQVVPMEHDVEVKSIKSSSR